MRQRAVSPYLRTIYQNLGDSLKADQYAVFIADNGGTEGENKVRASMVNELYQQHQQWELLSRAGELLGDLLTIDADSTESESTIELNLMAVKIKHTVKHRKKKAEETQRK